jgi:FKBP-type peptidyl-prolyl cis-trans isomerase (trigger factor)
MLESVRVSGGRVRGFSGKPEELRANALEIARRRVKELLLLEAVAGQEGITVTDAEVDSEVAAMATAYRDDAATIRRALEDPERRASLASRVLARKTLDFLYQHARITEGYQLIRPA